ncbi:MAG: rhamnan synthesis F family protein [Clostridiales bacterium]|nr:rhamnan synthesis F family protein [Clostridiales bacterium]
MKRMGIFVFYDASGIVDKYVEVLLDSMQEVLQRVVIIINGGIRNNEYNKLKKYSYDIYVRENVGFDAGAYKDIFTKYLAEEDFRQWDEIVLFNDTFYGPLYSWKETFNKMEELDVDFWGLSRNINAQMEGNIIPSHIQSFFLVCRKSLIMSELWEEFWRNLKYPSTLQEAIKCFELNFSVFFTQNGFKSGALTDSAEIEYVGNPYINYPYELVRNIRFPVIKRKAISLCNFKNVEMVINYVIHNTGYDTKLIDIHLKRLQAEGNNDVLYPFKSTGIERFYNGHKRIYIYGHGNYGQGMAGYFSYKGWKYEGFLVMKKTEIDDNVFEYENVIFDKQDGIILALGKKAFDEVYPIIRKKINASQLLLGQRK